MKSWFQRSVLTGIAAMSFASCTCNGNLPEPPGPDVERKGGFGALVASTPGIPGREIAEAPVPRDPTPIPPTLPESQDSDPTPATAELPADFPTDVPVFEGAEVYAVQELARGAKNVLFYVDAEAPEVFTFYKDNMRGEGWNIAQEYQAKEQSFLSFRKDKMITNMTIVRDPRSGRRVVAVMYYEEEELPFPEF